MAAILEPTPNTEGGFFVFSAMIWLVSWPIWIFYMIVYGMQLIVTLSLANEIHIILSTLHNFVVHHLPAILRNN